MFCHTKSQGLAFGAENKHIVTPSSKISHLLAFSLLHPTGPGLASRLQRNHWPLAHKKGPNPWPNGSQLLLSTPLPISAPSYQNPQPQRLGASKRGTEGLAPFLPTWTGAGGEGAPLLPAHLPSAIPGRRGKTLEGRSLLKEPLLKLLLDTHTVRLFCPCSPSPGHSGPELREALPCPAVSSLSLAVHLGELLRVAPETLTLHLPPPRDIKKKSGGGGMHAGRGPLLRPAAHKNAWAGSLPKIAAEARRLDAIQVSHWPRHLSLLSQVRQQGAGSEEQQLGLDPGLYYRTLQWQPAA